MTENIKTIGYVLMLLGVWSYVQDMEYTEKHEYTKGLERVIATCLSSQDQQIWIGNELYLCSATPTGVTKL